MAAFLYQGKNYLFLYTLGTSAGLSSALILTMYQHFFKFTASITSLNLVNLDNRNEKKNLAGRHIFSYLKDFYPQTVWTFMNYQSQQQYINWLTQL